MGLAWTAHLGVGNEIIDTGHKKLIAMINDAEHMIKTRDSQALLLAFDQIERLLDLHFADEEAIARAVKFSFAKHKQEHETVLKVLCFIRKEIAGKNGVWSEDSSENYAEILSDWLSTHILMEDMLMKPVLQTYPYDFKPRHQV